MWSARITWWARRTGSRKLSATVAIISATVARWDLVRLFNPIINSFLQSQVAPHHLFGNQIYKLQILWKISCLISNLFERTLSKLNPDGVEKYCIMFRCWRPGIDGRLDIDYSEDVFMNSVSLQSSVKPDIKWKCLNNNKTRRSGDSGTQDQIWDPGTPVRIWLITKTRISRREDVFGSISDDCTTCSFLHNK